ncbi:TraB/GumN family protein [Caulobacter endophyticus]|uniref:TraB/GumN family protein n=1 Tax=Caulobacter endophyticus TaxID=2172652 RepID=UPI0024100CFF|nr:TraB/GumN family protein [Caulobacter endophyticus]MDG2527729.1 TraB/GumN family protein [Caulobacter endophyticus]
MIRRIAAAPAVAGFLLALCAGPALAQQAVDASGPIDLNRVDPNENLVEELVVNARLPGPAWWKVSDDDTTVYVLGVPSLTPSGLSYDDTVIKRRLEGAERLIMGQEADVNIVRLVALAMGGRDYFLSEAPMRETLPPALRARLEARLAAIKRPTDNFDKVKPAFAGFLVAKAPGGNLSISKSVTEQIREKAKALPQGARPRIQNLPGYSLVGSIKALGSLPQPLQELCLEAGLREAESGQGGIKQIAERWAAGDVRAVVSADRGFQRCLDATPSIARELREGRDDAVKAVEVALKKPGKAVAVIELRSLLARDGVLDQLRAKGFKVTTPDE